MIRLEAAESVIKVYNSTQVINGIFSDVVIPLKVVVGQYQFPVTTLSVQQPIISYKVDIGLDKLLSVAIGMGSYSDNYKSRLEEKLNPFASFKEVELGYTMPDGTFDVIGYCDEQKVLDIIHNLRQGIYTDFPGYEPELVKKSLFKRLLEKFSR